MILIYLHSFSYFLWVYSGDSRKHKVHKAIKTQRRSLLHVLSTEPTRWALFQLLQPTMWQRWQAYMEFLFWLKNKIIHALLGDIRWFWILQHHRKNSQIPHHCKKSNKSTNMALLRVWGCCYTARLDLFTEIQHTQKRETPWYCKHWWPPLSVGSV